MTKSNPATTAAILAIVMLTAFTATIDGCSRSEDPGIEYHKYHTFLCISYIFTIFFEFVINFLM